MIQVHTEKPKRHQKSSCSLIDFLGRPEMASIPGLGAGSMAPSVDPEEEGPKATATMVLPWGCLPICRSFWRLLEAEAA